MITYRWSQILELSFILILLTESLKKFNNLNKCQDIKHTINVSIL